MTDLYTKSPEITNDFAAQAARDALGRHYVHPKDRDFVDHEPRWQQLGNVADGVVGEDRHLVVAVDGVIDVDHDMAEG